MDPSYGSIRVRIYKFLKHSFIPSLMALNIDICEFSKREILGRTSALYDIIFRKANDIRIWYSILYDPTKNKNIIQEYEDEFWGIFLRTFSFVPNLNNHESLRELWLDFLSLLVNSFPILNGENSINRIS